MLEAHYNTPVAQGVTSSGNCPHRNPRTIKPEERIPIIMSDGLNDTKPKANYCGNCGYTTCRCSNQFCILCNSTWCQDVSHPKIDKNKPSSEILSPGIDQIPFESLEELGAIFAEGEKKYGRGNWKKDPSNNKYNAERTRHALRHLFLYANGDRSENHLAKVMWFCCTTLWRSKQSI